MEPNWLIRSGKRGFPVVPLSSKIFLPDGWLAAYEKQPFLVTHNLSGTERFSGSALEQLAYRLPPEQIELNAGDVPVSLPPGQAADPRTTAAEYLADMESHRVWVGLLRLKDDPEYGPMLAELLNPIGEMLLQIDPGMSRLNGFIFVTSPRSVVPYHMDPEHNFLLQITGKKQFVIFDKEDSELVNDELMEWFYTQQNRRLTLPNSLAGRGRVINLEPGQGLHVPICAPHFVRTLDDVSVSLSITYATPKWNHRELVYRFNRGMRRIGLQPQSPGGRWDFLKGDSVTTWKRFKRTLPGREV